MSEDERTKKSHVSCGGDESGVREKRDEQGRCSLSSCWYKSGRLGLVNSYTRPGGVSVRLKAQCSVAHKCKEFF